MDDWSLLGKNKDGERRMEKEKKIRIVIQDTPPSLNELIGKPYGEVAGIKKIWADVLYVLAYQAGWRPAEKTKYKNCKVIMRFPSKRRVDEDNFRKVIKDALFYADLVWDDSVQKLNFSLTVIPDTGKRATEIELW